MRRDEEQQSATVSVGSWQIDRDSLSISDGASTESLEPRAFAVLCYLAERPGKLVTIDELMDALWADVVVTPNAVTRVIAQLRKALGDDARNPSYIQTVARTGYRLVAPVGGATPASKTHRRRPGNAVSFGVALLAIVAVIVTVIVWWPEPAPSQPSVAVLSFGNLTGDASLSYLGEGVADEVTSSLAQLPGLRVKARSLSFGYPDSDQSVLAFARSLDVGYAVAGSVRQIGSELRITAQLIHVDSGYHAWSNTIRKNSRDVFLAQDEISRGIVAALADELDMPAPQAADSPHVPDPEAYELYLKGRYIWHRRGSEPLQPAIDSFAEAVKIDPQFARAWAALASAYLTYPSYSSKGYATWQDAEDAARKALELDPTIPEAYGILGTFADVRRDWVAGHELFAEGVRVADASATAHYWYSEHLAKTGRYVESLRHIRRAREIDPTYVAPQLDEAFSLLMFGDYDAGATQFAELWRRGVNNVTAWSGYFVGSMLIGDFETARKLVEDSSMPAATQSLLMRFIDIEAGGSGRDELIDVLFGGESLPLDYRLMTWVGSRLGAYDEVIAIHRDRLASGRIVETRPLWGPGTDLFRQPGFVELLDELQLIDYWQAVDWGSICRLDGSTIVCDARNMPPDAVNEIRGAVDDV